MSENGQHPRITVEIITPQIAATLLGTMPANRPLRQAMVKRYAREMIAGRWLLNGEAIKIDRRGKLIDGQHRLNAIVMAETPVKILVVRGVDERAMITLDTGVARNFYDASLIAGKPYSARVGPIARIWANYEAGRGSNGGGRLPTPSHQELSALIEAHPAIAESAVYVSKFKNIAACHPSVQGFVHAYVSEKYDREMADTFVQCLAEGANLSKTDPIYVLRRRLIDDAALNGRRYDQYYVLALTIKTWNAWLDGEQIQVLRYGTKGNAAETFPQFRVDRAATKAQRQAARLRAQRAATKEEK